MRDRHHQPGRQGAQASSLTKGPSTRRRCQHSPSTTSSNSNSVTYSCSSIHSSSSVISHSIINSSSTRSIAVPVLQGPWAITGPRGKNASTTAKMIGLKLPIFGIWVANFHGNCNSDSQKCVVFTQSHSGSWLPPVSNKLTDKISEGAYVAFDKLLLPTRHSIPDPLGIWPSNAIPPPPTSPQACIEYDPSFRKAKKNKQLYTLWQMLECPWTMDIVNSWQMVQWVLSPYTQCSPQADQEILICC